MSRRRRPPPLQEPESELELEAVERTGGHPPLDPGDSVIIEAVDDDEEAFGSVDAPDVPLVDEPEPAAEMNDQTAAYDPPPELFAEIPDPEEGPAPAIPEPPLEPRPPEPAPAKPSIHVRKTAYLGAVRPDPTLAEDLPILAEEEPDGPVLVPRPEPAPALPRPVSVPRQVGPPPPAAAPARPRGAAVAPPNSEPSVVVERPEDPSIVYADETVPSDSLDGELTAVYEPIKSVELPRGRLLLVAGENAGKAYYLNRNRTSIGRGTDNDVVLLDIAVSRQHLELERHGEGYRAKDLSSGNGTYVNGRRVNEAELYDGDRIELGNIILDFTTVGNPRRREDAEKTRQTDPGIVLPSPAPGGRRTVPLSWLLLWSVTTFVAVLLAMFVTRLMTSSREEVDGPAKDKARAYVERADDAIRGKNWDLAEDDLKVAQDLAPELAGEFEDRLQKIHAERENRQALAGAKAALSTAEPDEIQERVAGIGAESAYQRDALALVAESRRLALERKVTQAETLLRDGKTAAAAASAREVLEQDGGNSRARAVVEAVEAAAKEARPAADIVSAAPREAGDDRRARQDLAEGLRLYRSERFSDAIGAFDRAARRTQSRALRKEADARAQQVKSFVRSWNTAQQAIRARRPAEATTALTAARRLDGQLGGGLQGKINKQAADQHYLQAIQAFSRQSYKDAAKHNQRVLRLAPSHPLGRKLAEKMGRTAVDLLRKAQAARRSAPDQARRLAQLAAVMCSEGDPTRQSANRLLQELGD